MVSAQVFDIHQFSHPLPMNVSSALVSIAKVAFFEIKPVHFKGISHCPFFRGNVFVCFCPRRRLVAAAVPTLRSLDITANAQHGDDWMEVLGWHRGTPPTNG